MAQLYDYFTVESEVGLRAWVCYTYLWIHIPCMLPSQPLAIDNPIDPIDVGRDFGIDTRVVRIGTTNAPWDDSLQVSIADQRTSRVSLWNKTKPDGQWTQSTVHNQSTLCNVLNNWLPSCIQYTSNLNV